MHGFRVWPALWIALLSACGVSRTIATIPIVPATRDATLEELVDIVNTRAAIESMTARADLQFETNEQAEEGLTRRFRTAQGRVIISRPDHLRLQIQAPVVGVSIADMASDGRRFQLLIYPEEYRALIEGSNNHNYAKAIAKIESDPELEKAGPLAYIRPQHFTQALMLDPIDSRDPGTLLFMEEERYEEDDDRPGARKDQKVIRSYYVLSVVPRGRYAPSRQYWFDRTRNLALSRQQLFDENALMVGDVSFSGPLLTVPDSRWVLSSEIRIERPYEEYALRLTLKQAGLAINRDIPETAFSLTPPEDWSSLRRVDLDLLIR